MGFPCNRLVGALPDKTTFYDHPPCVELWFSAPHKNDLILSPAVVTAKKNKTKKTAPRLCSSRSERRVLQRRPQPTPTQSTHLYTRRTPFLLAFVIRPVTTHPFRDGAPFPLLQQKRHAQQSGRSLRCFHILHRSVLLVLSPSCSAACGPHLPPRIATIFSLLSSVRNPSLPPSSVFSSPDRTHPVPP